MTVKHSSMLGILMVALAGLAMTVGCGAMRGAGPEEDVALRSLTIDQSTPESAALTALELLRIAGEEPLPEKSPREATYIEIMHTLIDGRALEAEMKTSRTGSQIKAPASADLVDSIIRQWPLLVSYYRSGFKTDQAIVQLCVPPAGISSETQVVFVPATHGDRSIWIGLKCVAGNDAWKVYHVDLYQNPPQPPIELTPQH
jgi:hypothetical protein